MILKEDKDETDIDKLWRVALKLSLPVVMALVGWVMSMSVRVSVLETDNAGRDKLNEKLLEQIKEDVQEIKNRLVRLEQK